MRTYLEVVTILQALADEAYIVPSVGSHHEYGACIFYSFSSLCMHFYQFMSLEYLKSTFEYDHFASIHDNYHEFKMKDGSVLQVPDNFCSASVVIPIKNT